VLETTSNNILKVLSDNSDREFYVNELIRISGEFPNSVTNSLKKLMKLGYVKTNRVGNRLYYSLSNGDKSYLKTEEEKEVKPADWVKLLNRKVACSFNAAVCQANILNLKHVYGVSMPSFWGNGITNGVYYSMGELDRLAERISSLIDVDKEFAANDIKNCTSSCSRLVEYSKTLNEKYSKNTSNKKLISLLEQFYEYYLDLLVFMVVPHSIEKHFEALIRKEVKSDDDLETLLSPVYLEYEELERMLKIVYHVKRHGYDSTYRNFVEQHRDRYCWLNMWDISESPLSTEHFDKSIRETAESVSDPVKEMQIVVNEEKYAKITLAKTLEKLKASRSLIDHVNLLQEYIKLRTVRKNSLSEAHYYIKPLLIEVARRLNIDQSDLFLMSYPEILDLLKAPSSYSQIEYEIIKRRGGYGVLMLDGKLSIISGIKEVVETIEKHRIIPQPAINKNNLITGRSANRGNAIGPAKVVYDASQLGKIQSGDILVAKMTTPDFVMAMRKCSGIITDEGGITCHASIVSREMNKPCIVGTKNATSNIQDGFIVELDATKGFARILQRSIVRSANSKIYGRPVFGRKVEGRVKIVNDDEDLARVDTGDIIVAPQLTPLALSVLFRIKGLIIEEDSLTSHAVLYAKTMNIPCIIGVSSARELFIDGERIRLDSTVGVVERVLTD